MRQHGSALGRKIILHHDFLPPLYNTQFQNTSGGLLFMNQLETVLYRTYVYRLYPTAEQQTMLADRFDFEDENYNAMARRINELYGQHAHKADAETAIRQYSISCPGIDYQGSLDHTRKELFQAVQKLWQGSYNKIYSRPVTRNQRCFYFKTMAVSEFHIIVPTIGTILRDTHRPLPVGAKALSGQSFTAPMKGATTLIYLSYTRQNCRPPSRLYSTTGPSVWITHKMVCTVTPMVTVPNIPDSRQSPNPNGKLYNKPCPVRTLAAGAGVPCAPNWPSWTDILKINVVIGNTSNLSVSCRITTSLLPKIWILWV